MTAGENTRTRRPGRRRRSKASRLLRLLLAVVVLLAAGGTLLFLRLTSGPLHSETLARHVALRAQEAMGEGAAIHIGSIGLSIDGSLQPVIHLRDVEGQLRGGDRISVDTAEATTTWSTLLRGERQVTRVAADHVLGEMVPGRGVSVPDPLLLLAHLEAELAHAGLGSAEIASLTVYTRAGDRRIALLEDAAVTLASPLGGPGETPRRIDFRVAGAGDGGPWSAELSVDVDREKSTSAVIIEARSLALSDVARRLGDEAPALTGTIDGEIEAEMNREGRLLSARGRLMVNHVGLGDDVGPHELLRRGQLDLVWDAEAEAITIARSFSALAEGAALISGTIIPPRGEDATWRFDLAVETVAGEGSNSAAGARAAIVGSYDLAASALVLDTLRVRTGATEFNAALRLDHRGNAPIAALSSVVTSMPVDMLKVIWPATIIPEARGWVRDHVYSGTIVEASVDAGAILAADAAGRVEPGGSRLAFRFENLRFRPFGGGPIIDEAVGTGLLDGARFTVTLERGTARLEDGRTLDVPAGTFAVEDVFGDPPDGRATIDLSGEAASMLALWQALPLSRGVDLGVSPQDLTGTGVARIEASMPLIDKLPAERVTYDAVIDLEGLGSAKAVSGRRFADAKVSVRVAEGRAVATGTAKVDGVATEISIDRPLSGGASGASSFRLVLDAAGRERFGIDLGDHLTGDVAVTVSEGGGGGGRQAVEADLTAAAIDFPELGWRKPKGREAKARFDLVTGDGTTRIEKAVFTAGDARIEGEIRLDAKSDLVSADFPLVRLSAGDRIAVRVTRGERGGLDLDVKGTRFDARDLIEARLKRGETGGGGKAIDGRISLRIGSVDGYADEELDGVNLDAVLVAGQLADLAFTAQTAGGGATSATVMSAGGRRKLTVEASEMGRLLRFLDYYGRVRGGRATFDAVIDANGAISGRLDGQRWRIEGEPALGRLASAAPDAVTGEAGTVEIRRLLLDLRLAGGRLSISDGVIRSAEAGLTLQGDVDFRRDSMNLSGSYLPARAFDTLLGRIPILGQTLFAGGRAGLVGVTFHLAGSVSKPALSINPLSVVAPGILRKLFELG